MIPCGLRRRLISAAGVLLALLLPACSVARMWRKPAFAPKPLATSLDEVFPHGNRDHFIYVFERRADGKVVDDGIQVENVKSVDPAGEFEISLSENGVPIGRSRYRDAGDVIELISEDYPDEGVRLSFEPPLPVFQVPLSPGERRSAATARVTRLKDGGPEGSLRVSQTVRVDSAPPGHTHVGDYDRAILLRTQRTTRGTKGDLRMQVTAALVPGIGEIRSEGQIAGGSVLHRELACAVIGGKRIGDCQPLKDRLQRSRPR